MQLTYKTGNLLDSEATFICHQINASGGFGTGVAGAIAKKYPEVKQAYQAQYSQGLVLGTCYVWQTATGVNVANLCAQKNYGYDGARYTSYDALWDSLQELKQIVDQYSSSFPTPSIAFPYQMSSVRGGACWPVVLSMIIETFKNSKFNIEIWKL